MSKKVLIISSSPRKGGNSETLAASLPKGLKKPVIMLKQFIFVKRSIAFVKVALLV